MKITTRDVETLLSMGRRVVAREVLRRVDEEHAEQRVHILRNGFRPVEATLVVDIEAEPVAA